MSRLRWGLLGTAHINRRLIPALRASARSVVHAVASRDPVRATTYARDWDIPHAHAPYDQLLADEVDVIYIALPNSLHVPWTLRALEAGKHVLCEKPLALSAQEVDLIAAAAAASDRVVAEGFLYRHHAQSARIDALITEGVIGEPRIITAAFTYTQSRSPDVRLDPALGGGALWDVGCYPVSFSNHVARSRPTQVMGWRRQGASGVDEHFAGTIVYENGVVAQFQAGFRAAYDPFARITGTKGRLEVVHPFRPNPVEHLMLHRNDAVETVRVDGGEVFADEVANFEDAALGLKPPTVSLRESRTLALTLESLHRAADTGGVVHPVT